MFRLGVTVEIAVLQVPRFFSETNLLLRLQEVGLSVESEVRSDDSQSTDRDTGLHVTGKVAKTHHCYQKVQL